MPYANLAGTRIHWTVSGPDDAPTIMLLNSIGTDMTLWDRVVPHLTGFRLLRMDTRGHGASDATEGDYSLSMLAGDVIAVMDAAGIRTAILAGVSLGGMIALQVALDHRERVDALLAICTSATMDSVAWGARVAKVRSEGMAAIVDLAMTRFLSPAFIDAKPELASAVRKGLLDMAPAGYAGCAAAIRDMDLEPGLHRIDRPVLVITGAIDTSTPYTGHGEPLVSGIPGAHHIELDCAHLAPIEAPEQLARAILDFAAIPHAIYAPAA